MNLQPIIEHIKKFVDFSTREEGLLQEYFTTETVTNKSYLLREGHICHANYFITKGCFRSYLIGKKGQEKNIHFGIEDWWVTDYDSFFNLEPTKLNIQAIEDSEVLKITKSAFEELMDKSPAFERYFRIILQKIFIASQRRIEYMFNMSGEEVYHMFVELNPGFTNRVPQYMLASYLGFTPEFLSKIRGKKS